MIYFRIKSCPPDGDCFFEAIGTQMGRRASTLREECRTLFLSSPLEERQIMAESEGCTWQQYAELLGKRGGLQGGHNEMVLLSKRFNLRVEVYVRNVQGFKHLTTVRCEREGDGLPVHLLWDGLAHYDALIPVPPP